VVTDTLTAVALVGIPQPPELPPCGTNPVVTLTLKDRAEPSPRLPATLPRVSTMRQGWIGWKIAPTSAGSPRVRTWNLLAGRSGRKDRMVTRRTRMTRARRQRSERRTPRCHQRGFQAHGFSLGSWTFRAGVPGRSNGYAGLGAVVSLPVPRQNPDRHSPAPVRRVRPAAAEVERYRDCTAPGRCPAIPWSGVGISAARSPFWPSPIFSRRLLCSTATGIGCWWDL
jgi:hypothetical protein